MRGEIPSVLGLLMMAGCSDAAAVGNAVETVCKQDCECPATTGWNEISNCKRACEGYATLLQAIVADEASEPCGNFRKSLNDLEKCARQEQCGPDRDACLGLAYGYLYECWPEAFNGYYGYTSATSGELAQVSGAEIMQQLLSPIPGALPPELLHSATRE
jgi:hypothetical protein